MQSPVPPSNERERLAALARYGVLDSDPEPSFDEIVRLAAYICQTPIASISLIDANRQWFKARVGVTASEGPRETSFCGHVVESGRMLVVPDARLDRRFVDNPAVEADSPIVFYAGAPLETAEGYTLGTLCTADHRPRELSPEQLDMLTTLSRIVVRQLDLQHSERRRQAVEAQLAAASQSARDAHRLRQRFFDVSLDMLCIAGLDGYFKELNPAWTKTLGWSTDELEARPFVDFVHPDDRAKTIAESAALVNGDHVTVHFENRYQTKSGDYRWLSWIAVPDMTNQVLLATARDVTLAKAREHELMVARRLAETANQAKSDFLAKMSHELRTPLNSVIGFTKLLYRNKKGNLDGQDLTYLDKIAKNGIHLLSLINDLLDLSKIEAGHAELAWAEVALDELLRTIYDELEGAVASEGNQLVLGIPGPLQPIRADARRLKQILINLVGNANKFTKRGTLELRVVASGEHPLRIDVVDSGIGIPASKLELVFEAFRQVSEGDARTHGGTGLGLAISRSLAQLHGFELGVTSVEGQGATFFLKLDPAATTPEHAPPRLAPSSSPRVSAVEPLPAPSLPAGTHHLVLLIEDDADARLLAARAVEQIGARIVSADSGEAGLAIAQALVPDLILLDLGLPDVHGREIVRRLSSDPRLQHIPVVIYSGQVDRAPTGFAGASVLEKPVTLDAIAQIVSQRIGPRRRVLIIDDDADTREVLRSLLHRLGFETLEAGEGAQGLRVLRDQGADLVLLDVCMPNMTGFEFLANLRNDPALASTPVVVCTALDLEPRQAADLANQTRAVVRKGYDIEGRLEEILRDTLRRPPASRS